MIVKHVKKPTGRSHLVEDAACPVKLGREVGSRGKELTADQFLGAKGRVEEYKPFLTPSLLSLLWSKDMLNLIGP